ncbi:CFI-box-CTERM domain-containing protein [uncultured Oscillibacter sp.]|uniref:CFI-box-CTERM domain-containing protein n=1 Tax=uncultured Oscillibacter sp. TaxID=876091 RepID=UPI00263154E0|nr:CFI-box-CTERM domain-containing protein [uncultured Oscillibacter sp.]
MSEQTVKITGPIEPNIHRTPRWENLWYNNTIRTVELKEIEIEYMDGSKETLKGSDIRYGEIPKPAGCYVATAVYGSYDCPQVWTLRRFRDDTLAGTWYGRAFIRAYYAVSPTLVRRFGETGWFQRLWRGPLDRLVDRLRSQGVEDTPYRDRDW